MRDKIIRETEEFVKRVNKNIEVQNNARNNGNDEQIERE